MATVKYNTLYGTSTIETNLSTRERRSMEPWAYKEKYTKDGWLREGALEKGYREVVVLQNGENEVTLYAEGDRFFVEGTACGHLYRSMSMSVGPMRDYFKHVVNKMYVD